MTVKHRRSNTDVKKQPFASQPEELVPSPLRNQARGHIAPPRERQWSDTIGAELHYGAIRRDESRSVRRHSISTRARLFSPPSATITLSPPSSRPFHAVLGHSEIFPAHARDTPTRASPSPPTASFDRSPWDVAKAYAAPYRPVPYRRSLGSEDTVAGEVHEHLCRLHT